MGRTLVSLLACGLMACASAGSQHDGPPDLNAGPGGADLRLGDSGTVRDLRLPVDLAQGDLTRPPDLGAPPPDLASPPPDLTTRPDLTVPPPDFTLPPDFTVPPDFTAPPPDLAKPPCDGNACAAACLATCVLMQKVGVGACQGGVCMCICV